MSGNTTPAKTKSEDDYIGQIGQICLGYGHYVVMMIALDDFTKYISKDADNQGTNCGCRSLNTEGKPMGMTEIRNKKGTAKPAPKGYSSWLEFWQNSKPLPDGTCKVYSCSKQATDGAHVIINGLGGKEYILAMCHECNSKPEDEVMYTNDVYLVPVVDD
ncbi:MAG: hypothetical protein KAR40_17880 [Candidatus Sabulitectum sp.]|nr:hypothetical protein [Candidatus Sabulitectum sp.]